MKPAEQNIADWTDVYFKHTKKIVETNGDCTATYAVFMRRPVVSAPRLAIEWLEQMAAERNFKIEIDLIYAEGRWVGAGEPMMYITGPMSKLCDLETLMLQKIGPACVAAANAFSMCVTLPHVAFLAMDARHCAGTEMAAMMAYAASVGSDRARRKTNATGFIGNATDATAHYFGQAHGYGTMPHALIGYAGSTVKAAQMFHGTLPDVPMTVLVDYFGLEITDSLAVCRAFPDLAAEGKLSLRLDTGGGRYVEGLDPQSSYAVLDRNVPECIRGYRTDAELKHLIGTGVSAAAIWHLREQLNKAGYRAVKIVASSGFSPEKCRLIADAHAPVDVIGTGSYLPDKWTETYATADIVAYNGAPMVKVGREFLLRKAAAE